MVVDWSHYLGCRLADLVMNREHKMADLVEH